MIIIIFHNTLIQSSLTRRDPIISHDELHHSEGHQRRTGDVDVDVRGLFHPREGGTSTGLMDLLQFVDLRLRMRSEGAE